MSSTCRRKLMEEIYDQFLRCKICFDVYTCPKTLSCLHTFCELCLDRHQSAELERSYRYSFYTARSITCPICRKKTELPVGGVHRLPDNIIVPRLVDMVARSPTAGRKKSNNNEPVAVMCEICQVRNLSRSVDNSSATVAVLKCLDCCKALCRMCSNIHRRTKVTSEHSLVDVDVEDKDVTCKTHDSELIRYYCEQCSTCICVVCAFESPHRGHEVLNFPSALSRHGHALDSLVDDCKTRITSLRQQLQRIRDFEADIALAEEQVRGAAIDCIAAVRQHERTLLSSLSAIFAEQPRVKAFLADRPAIETTVRSLENTCQLSDVIARERSVELLLLKDDLTNRMTSLLQTGHVQLAPEVDTKSVRFVATSPVKADCPASGDGLSFGRLDFFDKRRSSEEGCEDDEEILIQPPIEDSERKMKSAKRQKLSSSSSSDDDDSEMLVNQTSIPVGDSCDASRVMMVSPVGDSCDANRVMMVSPVGDSCGASRAMMVDAATMTDIPSSRLSVSEAKSQSTTMNSFVDVEHRMTSTSRHSRSTGRTHWSKSTARSRSLSERRRDSFRKTPPTTSGDSVVGASFVTIGDVTTSDECENRRLVKQLQPENDARTCETCSANRFVEVSYSTEPKALVTVANTASKRDAHTDTEQPVVRSTFTNTPARQYCVVDTNTARYEDVATNTTPTTYFTIDTNTTIPQRTDFGSNTAQPVTRNVESNTIAVEKRAIETNTTVSNSIATSTHSIESVDAETNTSLRVEVALSTRQITVSTVDTNTAVLVDRSTSTLSTEIATEYCTQSTDTTAQASIEETDTLNNITECLVDAQTQINTFEALRANTESFSDATSSIFVETTEVDEQGKVEPLHGSPENDASNSTNGRCVSASMQTDDFIAMRCDTGTGDNDVTTFDRSTVTSSTTPSRADKETATATVRMIHRCEATDSVNTTSVGTMPADDVTTAYRNALAAHTSRPMSVSRGTSTPAKPTFADGGTSTEQPPLMVDVGTVPADDVTAAYRNTVGGRERRVTISRGTLTTHNNSPPTRLDDRVDRASSPIGFRGVDKSVLVNRASLTEPSEVFVRAKDNTSPLTGTLRRQISGSCPRMDSICEGSEDSASDEGEPLADTLFKNSIQARLRHTRPTMPAVPALRRPLLPPRPLSDDVGRFRVGVPDRRNFPPLSPMTSQRTRFDEITSPKSVVKSDVDRRCVDASTNTTSALCCDQATTTDSMTSSVVVDGKMAECISKLRTVRQRLEHQQSTISKTGSPPEQRHHPVVGLQSLPESPEVRFETKEPDLIDSTDDSANQATSAVDKPTGSSSGVPEKKPATDRLKRVNGSLPHEDADFSMTSLTKDEKRTANLKLNIPSSDQTPATEGVGGGLVASPPLSSRILKGELFPGASHVKKFASPLSSPLLAHKTDNAASQSSPRSRPRTAGSKPDLPPKVVTSPPLKRGIQLPSVSNSKPRRLLTDGSLQRTTLSPVSGKKSAVASAAIDEEKAVMYISTDSSTSSSSDDQDAVLLKMMRGVQAAGSAAQRSRQHRQLPQSRQTTLIYPTATKASSPPSGTASQAQLRKTSLARKQRLDLTQLLLSKNDGLGGSSDVSAAATSGFGVSPVHSVRSPPLSVRRLAAAAVTKKN